MYWWMRKDYRQVRCGLCPLGVQQCEICRGLLRLCEEIGIISPLVKRTARR